MSNPVSLTNSVLLTIPVVSFRHLRRLTDANGLFEHAEGALARNSHGYCVDDAARALVVVCREFAASPGSELDDLAENDLAENYLTFVIAAQSRDGRFRNRRAHDGHWQGRATLQDCWGRALWGLGTAASTLPTERGRSAALTAFARGARQRSLWVRPMAFAALGAAEVLRTSPEHSGARALLAAAANTIGRPRASRSWPWPEDRLHYANAVIPEALLAAGSALDDNTVLSDGLVLLDWLVEEETRDGHFSLTPVGGRALGDLAPSFDQQPIEAAALADACARAFEITGDNRWAIAIELAVAWFLGNNDSGASLYDPETGGGYDGLERGGRNENQGAESTLAALSTLQHGHSLFASSR